MGIIPHQLVLRRMFGLTPEKIGALTTNMGLGSATTRSNTRIIPCSNSNFTGSGCGRYTLIERDANEPCGILQKKQRAYRYILSSEIFSSGPTRLLSIVMASI